MESIPARPGSPLPSPYNRIDRSAPARTPPVARPSGSRSRPLLMSRKSSMDVVALNTSAMPPPRGAGRGLLKPSKSSADLPALLAIEPPSVPSMHATDSATLLAAFPAPPPLHRRTSEPLSARRSASHLVRERPRAYQAARVTVPTMPSARSAPATYRVADIEEATVASPPPVICPALPFDLVPCRKIHLRRLPPSSPPRAFREQPRPSPLKRAWSGEDLIDEDEDCVQVRDGWYMKVLMESVRDEDEDEEGWIENIHDSTVSIQELPFDCTSDDYEEDPFHFDRNIGYPCRV